MKPGLYIKLSIMMFLQYAIWGSWAVSLGGYLDGVLKFSGVEIGAVYATTAIAAMVSPLFLGYLTDRLIATERMIAILHLAGAGLLIAASQIEGFQWLRGTMLLYALLYMPTLALTNSISFANIDNAEQQFPKIRIWGTLGWIAAGLAVDFVLKRPDVIQLFPESIQSKNVPMAAAGVLSAALGLFSFFLPHTPPKGNATEAGGDDGPVSSGSSLFSLLRDPSFLIFVVASFLICIPLTFYYGFCNVFLTQREIPNATALQTLGQVSEVFFMAAMPFFIARMGVKWMLIVGMLAWVARYVLFASLSLPLIVIGLILHGVCYDFFFVASQIYVDNRADAKIRSSAQSFIAFVTLGLGMFVGNYVAGEIVGMYPARVNVVAVKPTEGAPDDAPRHFELSLPGSREVLATVPEAVVKGTEAGAVPEAVKTAVDTDRNGTLSTGEWLAARTNDWPTIWLMPAAMAGITCLLFALGFRAPKPSEPLPAT
jgi:nucleoside transporter